MVMLRESQQGYEKSNIGIEPNYKSQISFILRKKFNASEGSSNVEIHFWELV